MKKLSEYERKILQVTVDAHTVLDMLLPDALLDLESIYRNWKKSTRVTSKKIELTFPDTFWEFLESGKEHGLTPEILGYLISAIILPFFEPVREIVQDLPEESNEEGKTTKH